MGKPNLKAVLARIDGRCKHFGPPKPGPGKPRGSYKPRSTKMVKELEEALQAIRDPMGMVVAGVKLIRQDAEFAAMSVQAERKRRSETASKKNPPPKVIRRRVLEEA